MNFALLQRFLPDSRLIYLHRPKRDFQAIRYCGVIVQSQQKSNSEMQIIGRAGFTFVARLAKDVGLLGAIGPQKYC